MNEEFVINTDDLKPVEIPFKWEGKDYVLTEASEAAKIAYDACMTRGMKWDDDGKPISSSEGLHEADSVLVSGCVFPIPIQRTPTGTKVGVPLATIKSWDSRLVKRLYEMAKKISDIGIKKEKGDDNSPKGEQPPTADISS